MKFTRAALFLFAVLQFRASGQAFDASGNGMLNGAYYFREVFFTATDSVALYGSINFSNGTYSMSAQLFDCNLNQCFNPATYTPAQGTYSIAASGYGFISNQLQGGQIYGLVGANGVFVGSSTEGGNYDLFIAAPINSQSTSTLSGSYALAYMDPTGELTQVPFDAQLQMNSNGAGNIGTVGLTAYANSSTPLTQNIGSVTYLVSNNAFVLNFPNSSTALIQGKEYLYSTPDGSFVFGGSPLNFDMIVGVKTGQPPSFGGLYYEAGQDLNNLTGNFDTYYGSINAFNGIIVGHQRLQFGGVAATDFTYNDTYTPGVTSYTDSQFGIQYTVGTNGMRIGLGIGPTLNLSVAVPAPALSGSGVYLNPAGVVNSANSAPFTAGVSRGELLTLVGTNLGPTSLTLASTLPFPTKLGGVQVMINGVAAPIYYVSATQLSVIVPWETSAGIAQVQVINNGAQSNVVTEFVSPVTPGIFTIPPGGIYYAAAEHLDGSIVTPSKPAQAGEYISVFVTGLGDVSPSISDGAAGIVANTTNTITADIGGISATVSYAGLAPGLAGLYQVNIQIPSGVTAGDNYLDIGTGDGTTYSQEALISIGSGSTASPLSVKPGPKARTHGRGLSRTPSRSPRAIQIP